VFSRETSGPRPSIIYTDCQRQIHVLQLPPEHDIQLTGWLQLTETYPIVYAKTNLSKTLILYGFNKQQYFFFVFLIKFFFHFIIGVHGSVLNLALRLLHFNKCYLTLMWVKNALFHLFCNNPHVVKPRSIFIIFGIHILRWLIKQLIGGDLGWGTSKCLEVTERRVHASWKRCPLSYHLNSP